MAETRGPWLMRTLYVAVCMVLLFVQLLPLDTVPKVWAAPELIVAVTLDRQVGVDDHGPVTQVLDVVQLLVVLADPETEGVIEALLDQGLGQR